MGILSFLGFDGAGDKKRIVKIALGLAAAVVVAFIGLGRSRAVEPGVASAVERSAAEAAPRMLELYTPWCPTCVKMKPVVEDLAARCAGNGVRIDTVDVSRDENARITERYGVRAVPTFLFLDENGVESGRLVGVQTAMDLRRGIKELAGASCGGPVSTDRRVPPVKTGRGTANA